jgi:hypothetical protein
MNFAELIQRLFFRSGGSAERDTARPGWRHSGYRMRKARTPFAGRKRQSAESHMTIEEFSDKDQRNERFHQLRAQGTPHVSKFSTVKNNKSVWCVVRP